MLAVLRLEIFGDDSPENFRCWLRVTRDRRKMRKYLYPEPWVARIVAMNPEGKREREFLRGERDYTLANETGTRGVFKTFWLQSGEIYEVSERLSVAEERRWFGRVTEAGDVERLTEAEAREWLKHRSASTS